MRQGFRVFVRQPLGLRRRCSRPACSRSSLLSLLPVVGPLLLLALLPLGSLGFMIATRGALDGRLPMPGAFVAPLRSRPRRAWSALLKLGVALRRGHLGSSWR